MKKNLLLSIAAVFLIVASAWAFNDGWVYLAASLVAILIVAVIRGFDRKLMKLTRWAKANPLKTQVLITVLQLVILCLGLLVGYDLKELGYHFSNTPTIVFASILTAGFLSIRFLPKRNTIAIPALVFKDKIAYLSIILSAFVLMIVTGNRVEERFPNSVISYALRSIDQAIFSQDILSDEDHQQAMLTNETSSMFAFASIAVAEEKPVGPAIHPGEDAPDKIKDGKKVEKLEKKKMKMMKRIERFRKAFAAGSTVGTVLLIILLIFTTCAGICLIAIGGSAGAIAAGILITAASIWGFVKILNKNKRTKPSL